jgi:hypothetical protein
VVLPKDEGVGNAVVFLGCGGGVLGNSPGSAVLVALGVLVTVAVAAVRTSLVLFRRRVTQSSLSLLSRCCKVCGVGFGVTGRLGALKFTGLWFL